MSAGQRWVGASIVAFAWLAVRAADPPADPDAISPAWFKLPAGNLFTSDQTRVRVYKYDEHGKKLPAGEQAKAGYPKFLSAAEAATYKEADDERKEYHGGVDVSSYANTDSKTKHGATLPQEITAGVYGTVVKADPNDPLGRVVIKVDERGNTFELLHLSKMYLAPGTAVTPYMPLGVTGSKGANAIHLHFQAKNKSGQVLDATAVLKYAHKPPEKRKKSAWFPPVPREYKPPSPATPSAAPPAKADPPVATDDPAAAMTRRLSYLDAETEKAEANVRLVFDDNAKAEIDREGCRGKSKKAADDKAACETEAKALAERKASLQERATKLKDRRAELDREKQRLDDTKADFDRRKTTMDRASRKRALDELNAAIDAYAAKDKEYARDKAALQRDAGELNRQVDAAKAKGRAADDAAATAARNEKQLAAKSKLLALKKTQADDALKALRDERKQLADELAAEKANELDPAKAKP